MQEHGKQRYVAWMGCFVLAASALASSGCAGAYHLAHYNWFSKTVYNTHRPYFHSGHTGRIIPKKQAHFMTVEPDCFGYESTCWHNWPVECSTCPPPDQILSEEEVQPEPIRTPESVEDVPQMDEPGRGLDGILDLDDPKPGEEPILDPGGGETTMAPMPSDTPVHQFMPQPESATVDPPVVKQDSSAGLIHERPVINPEPAPQAGRWETAIARRNFNERMVVVEELSRPRPDKRNDAPLAFVDREPEVEQIAPETETTLPVVSHPAPAAAAPPVDEPKPTVQSNELPVQSAEAAAPPADASARRILGFVTPAPLSHVEQLAAESGDAIEIPTQSSPAVQPARPAVQVTETALSEGQPSVTVQKASLPSFKITPVQAEEMETAARAKTKATVRFVSSEKPKAVRVRTSRRKDADAANLKFR